MFTYKEDSWGKKERVLTPKGSCIITASIVVVVLVVLILILSLSQVRHGNVKLVTQFGALTGRVLEPGIHLIWPVVNGVVKIPTVIQSYETSDYPKESNADYTDFPVTAQTVDGQQISIKYTVIFRMPLDRVTEIVQNVGPMREVVENIVKAHSRNLTRLIVQSFTAEELYSGDGIFEYQSNVSEQLIAEFEKYGVVLDDFLVRKIDFDADYIAAIEQQQIAQEAIETAQYQSEAAEHKRDRRITLAEAEKERNILLAQAEAEQTRLAADAEAYSIEVRGAALRQNPELVQWEFVKNLEGVQWGIMPDSSVTPLLPVPDMGRK
jgi:regulator of protease activity HflC (stomatin/prohibitin superfamily)